MPRAHIDPVTSTIQAAALGTWTFTSSGSKPATADSTITDYRWDFAYDGVTFTLDVLATTPGEVDWQYNAPGIYTVALEVVDSTGATDITTMTAQAYDPLLGLQVLFSGGSVLDFGSAPVGDVVDRNVFLVNNSGGTIQVTGMTLTGIVGVTAAAGVIPSYVLDKDYLEVPLRFVGTEVADYPYGSIDFVTNLGAVPLDATAQATPGFAPAGTMNTGRHSHTATLLEDGRVLVVGGVNAAQAELSSAELYNPDPLAEGFSAGPDMDQITSQATKRRAFHTATRVSSGEVLVAGGQYRDPDQGGKWVAHNDVLVYHPNPVGVGTWVSRNVLAGDPRTQHVAVRVTWESGNPKQTFERVVLVGGKANPNDPNEALATVEVLLPTGVSESTAPLLRTRVVHAAVEWQPGWVLIVGGRDAADPTGATAEAELFNVAFGTWSRLSNLSPARAGMTVNALFDAAAIPPSDRYFIVGGHNRSVGAMGRVDEFSGASFQSHQNPLLKPRHRHRTVDLGWGRGLLVVGGLSSANTAVSGAEILSLDINGKIISNSAGGAMHTARGSGHTATVLLDGSVLVTGGTGPNDPAVAAAERYISAR